MFPRVIAPSEHTRGATLINMGRGRRMLSRVTFGLVKPEVGDAQREHDLLAQRMRGENTQARAKRDERHRPPPPPIGAP
jgi:hypothetical protein